MELEEARRIIHEHNAALLLEDERRARAQVGRFFKRQTRDHHPEYPGEMLPILSSVSDFHAKHWEFVAVRLVDGHGVHGLRFEKTTEGTICIRPIQCVGYGVLTTWTEIDRAEFEREAEAIVVAVAEAVHAVDAVHQP